MKVQFKLIFYSLIFGIAFFLSCKREIIYEGPRGEFKGNVALYNSVSKITDCSGVLVTIEGSTPHLQTITNAIGDWDIKNLATGNYNVVFSKDSFAIQKIMSWQFIGGTIPYITGPVQLDKLPYNSITEFSIDTSSWYGLSAQVTLNLVFQVKTPTYFRIYISQDPKVSFSNYQSTFQGYYRSSANFSFSISGDVYSKLRRGISLYAICYPCSSRTNSFTDMVTGNQIFGVNTAFASQIVPFTIPITRY